MALIYNTTNEEQTVKALGNFFTFKPQQIKAMEERTANFILSTKKESGLVGLPETVEGDEMYRSISWYTSTPEGKAELEKVKEHGLTPYLAFHRSIIANNQVHLRQALEQKNIKADPAAYASDGELASMELVAKYQRADEDKEQKRIERVKELMKTVGKK